MLSRRVRPEGPLRVLFVVPQLGFGGAERHVATLLPRLDRSRFSPSLLCIGRGGSLFDEVAAAGVPARALHRGKGSYAPALAEMVGHMRRTRPDIVVTRGAKNAEVLGRLAALLSGVPCSVVWVHNNEDLRPRDRVRRLSDRLLDRFTSAYFGVAFAQLPYLTATLGYPPEKIRIIQNGVDVAQFEPHRVAGRDPALAAELGVAADEPVVGIVAVLRPEKDHAGFLRAARLVLERHPKARFLVVGRGAREGELKALAAELGIADRVVFTGARSDVPAILGLLDVFVLSSYTEAFPMAVLEAMAVGTPAVCTAVGGVPEMVDDGVTGHLVPPRDPAALAARVGELLADRGRAQAMGAAARAKLEADFSLELSVRRAEEALAETAGRVPAGA